MGVLTTSPRFVAAATSITDSFDRADSTTTLGNADTGQTWTALAGTWGISSNRAYLVTSTGDDQNIAVVDAGVADCTVAVTVPTTNSGGLCFRVTDNNNNFVTDNNTVGFPGLYRRTAGGYSTLLSLSAGANGDVLSVVLSGTSIDVRRNGSSIGSTTDSQGTSATSHGMRSFQSTTIRFDDFSVTA